MIKEGKTNFFMIHGQVSMGTVHKCEKCGEYATVNSVTICKGPNYKKAKLAAEANGEINMELFYNGDTDSCLCEKCDAAPQDKPKKEKMVKVTDPKLLEILTFLVKKKFKDNRDLNLPIISNVRATTDGFILNFRMYNRKTKKFEKKKDEAFEDKAVIEVLEFQMNYRTDEDYAMMRDDFVPKVEKVNMETYNNVKFNKVVKKPKVKGGIHVIVMDEKGMSEGEMDIGGIHDLLSKVL